MALAKKTLKARLLEQYGAQLDEMLEAWDGAEQHDLTEIEALALQLRQEVGQAVTEVLAVNESQKQAVDIACPSCQQPMRYKGRKRKWIKTRTGDVQIERAYYYCAICRTGHFPLG